MRYQTDNVRRQYSPNPREDVTNVVFLGTSKLEIEVERSSPESVEGVKIDKAGAICAYFLCGLPFDC